MKNHALVFAVSAGLALGASAQSLPLQKSTPLQKEIPVRVEKAEVVSSRTLPSGVVEQEVRLSNGLKMKTVKGLDRATVNSVINPMSVSAKSETLPEGYSLYEDFEEWDGENEATIPEGWSVDHKNSPESNRGWKMTKPLSAYDYISSKCLTYETFEEDVDEWVVTPEVEVGAGMQLCWSTMTSPYFYDWSYMDSSFNLTKFVTVNDIKVNVSVDGGKTWENIFSHAQDLIRESNSDFFSMFNYTVRPFSVSLAKYAGKTIKIGFQVVGIDGNTTFLDDVSVGLPPTKTAYTRPLSNLYFGLTDTDEWLPASVMVGPVFEPVKYTNTTKTAGAQYTWTYADSTDEVKTSDEKNLTVTYTTDYSSELSTRNNFYDFPVLTASSPSTSPVDFSYPGYYQAGGSAEYERYFTETQQYETIALGMTVADPMTEGTATYADIILPYFGYNQESDRFWGEYSFGNEYKEGTSFAHLEKYADFFYSPESPMVIEGIRANAYGKISRDAKFSVEIFPLNSGYVPAENPIATAFCTGDDITVIDRLGSSDFLSLNFKFEQPIVISKSVMPYFIVAIGGFRDAENVSYFSPEMSAYSNPNGLGLGWIGKQLCYQGDYMPFSWTPVANYTDDELVAFYIMLDGSFPWLTGSDDDVTVGPGGSATVVLDSYFDGSALTFEGLPDGLTATATGRYGNTAVTFSAASTMSDGKATVTVAAPGLKKQINIVVDSAGIDDILSDSEEGETAVFTLDGRRVADDRLAPGVYIRRVGSRASKILVK